MTLPAGGSSLPTTTGTKTMTLDQFSKLAKVVYDRSGIHFQPAKKYVLESRLGRRLDELELDNFDQYLTYLTTGPYREDEFQEMFNRITINETSFFRNEPQLQIFETVTLPELIDARKTTKRLRIWSAACSSGEEPYTLAIQVHRSLGVRLADWTIEILGTDISEKVLEMAATGKYSSYATRSMSPMILNRYFKTVDGYSQIDPTVQSMVRFERLNLKDTLAARRFGTFDVIFCRNVMIYFDDPMKLQVIKMFHNQLADDGTLYIGHSESIRSLPVAFAPMPQPQSFAYTKDRNA
ncbi:MAG: protein-glutamate O-methyltransferase CheR [Planctomycetota bacterium]|nr:protein-glutamate O-methyltransferase CheR [Planctomycetota bacterium]